MKGMLQSPLEIQHNMPTGAIFEYQSESAFADLSDMNPTESKRKNKRPANLRAADNPFLAMCKGTDPKDAVFWVPAQIHPEVAPNEFNSWIEKRASALNLNEKRATRRKSILALHSYTSEQLVNESKEPPIIESPVKDYSKADLPVPSIPLSPSLFRRHTYNNNENNKNSNRKGSVPILPALTSIDLLIKKEKDEFIVIPKMDAVLKRSARARPRKELSTKSGRKKPLQIEAPLDLPINSMVPHRKTVSEPIFEETEDKDLLEEINSLLSTKIVVKDKGNIFYKRFLIFGDKIPKKITKSLTQHGDGKRVSIMTSMKQKMDGAAPDLFDYFDAPVQEVVPPTLSREGSSESVCSENTTSSGSQSPPDTPEPSLSPSSTLELPTPILASSASSQLTLSADTEEPALDSSTSSQLTLPEPSPSHKSGESIQSASTIKCETPSKNGPTRSAKKPFSWFWNTEPPGEKKTEAQKVLSPEPTKLSPPQTPTRKRSPTSSKISLEMDLSPPSLKSKTTKKEKSKISLFFLGKDKNKVKKDKHKHEPKTLPGRQDSTALFPSCDPCDLPPHVEQQLYRLSHQKLASPKRPLAQQVVISNLMLAYLRAVNPNFRSQQNRSKPKTTSPAPRPRSPHLISKERYKNGRRQPVSSSSEDDDEDSPSDSSSDDDDSLYSFGVRKSPRVTLA